ncbi:MAG: serpin family protein [Promethearchaeota archaeon]
MSKQEIKEIINGINTFALNLLKELRITDENIFFSPFSIQACVTMAYAGAREKTAEEIKNVFKLSLKNELLHPIYKEYLDNLKFQDKGDGLELHVANSIWVAIRLKLLDDYLNTIKDNYGENIFEVDFKMGSTLQQINGWVQEQTKGKIDKVSDSLNPNTKMILINAIYFKGLWLLPFKENKTKDLPFTLKDGSKKNVPMMFEHDGFKYLEGSNFQLLEMKYKNTRFSMVILLPKTIQDLEYFEKNLTIDQLDNMLKNSNLQSLLVYVPKFEFKTAYNLNSNLMNLGMKDAFLKDEADFSGMTGEKDFYIDLIIHKAYINVNEEGTEAAAITAVLVTPTGLPPPPPPTFKADHPFLFFILDKQNGGILFMGRIMDPQPE